ncbi:HAD family hydrolase [Trichocoleus sp. FACHB-262]|uniref:HAD family hydrolase n=1 Tax=Trichocoleus sp. FACHB-262 TaxID=2692869 RepID=UPI0016880F3B|nr:HAD family hydrolase [Trichocoleus sp. FACHB-262]MBD2123632.1 HAD family hydrolase [Trichocoleus sp. FACHB-262]
MPITAILFDLDGTLTDPKPGITRSIQHALSELGYPSPAANDLLWCIGPPLQQSFATLLHTSDKVLIDRAVTLYRDRYATIGLFENSLYPQIVETLETMRAAGYQTLVATSKPQIYALRIVEHFKLTTLFDGVYGSELDGTRSEKDTLIAYILKTEQLAPANTVMVGDRKHDMIGAKRNRMGAIGITYGYGTVEELELHGADRLAHSPAEIPTVLLDCDRLSVTSSSALSNTN